MSFDFSKKHTYAAILMAGKGLRMNVDLPKQFIEVAGLPLFLYASKEFENSNGIDFIIFVTSKENIEKTEKIIKEQSFKKPCIVIEGGSVREESAKKAIDFLVSQNANEESIVLIHDADRPNINGVLINANVEEASKYGAAITASSSVNSLASSNDGFIDAYLNREEVFQIQTPQTFSLSLIREAFEKAGDLSSFTDEGSLVLAMTGTKSKIVKAGSENYKITTESDLDIFEKGRTQK